MPVIRNLIIGIILVVGCFILGSYAVDGGMLPIFILGSFIGLFLLNYLGRRAWILVFIAPPILNALQLRGWLQGLPTGFFLSGVILVYWLFLSWMGYVTTKWRSVFWADLIVLLIFIHHAICYYRHPVAIYALGMDFDMVGGKVYVFCIAATCFYVMVSVLPISYEQVRKVFFWTFLATVAASLYDLALSLRGGAISAAAEGLENERVAHFTSFGVFVFTLVLCRYPLSSILTSIWKLAVCLISFVLVAMSGFRENIVRIAALTYFVSFVHRQILLLLFVSGLAYAGLLFISLDKGLHGLPFGVQRAVSIMPGVEVEDRIKRDADYSSDWRVVMWEWAFDDRMNYIEDRVWGDGYGVSLSQVQSEAILISRGRLDSGDQQVFASRGLWHSGPITAIHRIGYVGLAIVVVFFIYGSYLIYLVASVYRGTTMAFYALFLTVEFFADGTLFFLSAGSMRRIFMMYFEFAVAKMLYCIARDEGLLDNMRQGKKYIPLVYREN